MENMHSDVGGIKGRSMSRSFFNICGGGGGAWVAGFLLCHNKI